MFRLGYCQLNSRLLLVKFSVVLSSQFSEKKGELDYTVIYYYSYAVSRKTESQRKKMVSYTAIVGFVIEKFCSFS